MTTDARPLAQDLSRDYLLSDEFILFIVRFGLRLTASRWGMSERTLRRLFHALGTTPRTIICDVRRREAQRLLATDQPFPDGVGHESVIRRGRAPGRRAWRAPRRGVSSAPWRVALTEPPSRRSPRRSSPGSLAESESS